ncbi:MAG: efflux RND transporter permease subunit [Planctomycetes bacterium]|nr:efflux RND transporter permease subunit [Planctomycetota bacterium]
MLMILAGGILSIFKIKVEIFPDMTLDMVTVSVPYLGASPAEVEEGVCIRVEEAIAGIDGIKRLNSTASEGVGLVVAEVEEFADSKKVLDDIKAGVSRIITFPKETEKPIISEVITRNLVVSLVVYGDASERTLKNLAQRIRDDLTAMDNISQVDISGARRFEISIEVPEKNLRRHNLTFTQVASAVRESSLDLPGGSVKTPGGQILIRTKGQKYTGVEFEDIVVLARNDGTKLYLKDIATIIDGFEDSDIASRFDNKPSVMLQVYRVGDQGVLDIASTLKKYIAEQEKNLPSGISIGTWFDRSDMLHARMGLLTRNARIGLILVFLCLALFLDLRLAFWTTMGIPISFMGAFWIMPSLDASVNMISLFAFILSLGIVVDDAIVVGENIFAYRQKGMNPVEAAVRGVREMTAPVVMAVLTTVIAFTPLLYLAGIMGKFIRVIPIVVISVLMFSLVESLLILPAHLSGGGKIRRKKSELGPIGRFQLLIRNGLDKFIYGRFSRFVEKAVAWRYVTVAIAIFVLMCAVGYVKSGRMKFVMLPKIDADNVWASLRMPQGTSVDQTAEVVKRIEAAAEQVRAEIDKGKVPDAPSVFKHVATDIGSQPFTRGDDGGPHGSGGGATSAHLAEVNIELLSGEDRNVRSLEIANRWREAVGSIPGISSLTFTSSLFTAGDAINIEMSHSDFDMLLKAADGLKLALTGYNGVSDIDDSFEPGKLELKLTLTEDGRTLGLTLEDLARQARQGFYGEEIQRPQRGRDDIRVMVRYPLDERKSVADIENVMIRLRDGTEIPFGEVATVKQGRGYASIKRSNRRRVVSVTADVDSDVANPTEINKSLFAEVLPKLMGVYPGLTYKVEGEQREQKETKVSLLSSVFIALLAIYALLAVQFKSYIQPTIIMSAIPFGLVGAIIGHIVMGFDLSMLSIFGIVALTGVVVNDSLIMIDLINREREEGIELHQVIRDSATRRFRPILLTTLTTFFGLAPMLLEKSLQARFLIPMAVSLAFGIVFATVITLILVPSLYMVIEDVKALPDRIRGKKESDDSSNIYT